MFDVGYSLSTLATRGRRSVITFLYIGELHGWTASEGYQGALLLFKKSSTFWHKLFWRGPQLKNCLLWLIIRSCFGISNYLGRMEVFDAFSVSFSR